MADPTTAEEPPATGDSTDTLGDPGKKALDAERKARKAAEDQLKDLQAKFQEIEDKDKSEVDKLRTENERLKADLGTATAKADRYEVAMAKGLTAAQAKRLVGSTREEIEADADEILEAFPAGGDATPPPTQRPATDLRGGTDPTQDQGTDDPAKLAETVPRF